MGSCCNIVFGYGRPPVLFVRRIFLNLIKSNFQWILLHKIEMLVAIDSDLVILIFPQNQMKMNVFQMVFSFPDNKIFQAQRLMVQ